MKSWDGLGPCSRLGRLRVWSLGYSGFRLHFWAYIITYTILGFLTLIIVIYPPNPILIHEAPTLKYPYRSLIVTLIDPCKGTLF